MDEGEECGGMEEGEVEEEEEEEGEEGEEEERGERMVVSRKSLMENERGE